MAAKACMELGTANRLAYKLQVLSGARQSVSGGQAAHFGFRPTQIIRP